MQGSLDTIDSDHSAKVIGRAAELAAPIFDLYQWEWSSAAGVPTEADIRATLMRLAQGVITDDHLYASTGRLTVTHTESGLNLSLDLGTIYPKAHDDTNGPEYDLT